MEKVIDILIDPEVSQTSLTVPVMEEQIIFEKKIIETGKVIIAKRVEENIESFIVPLLHDEYHIEHVSVGRLVDEVPSVTHEGNVMIIPVIKEVIVKRFLLVEEIRITKQVVETNDQQQVNLRKEVVTVERSAPRK